MAKLSMGTDGALALQTTIQTELARRGYSSEADPVMAEYITIMVINDKTPDQINSELADLIGPDYELNFTDWLFAETAKAAAPATSSPSAQPRASDPSRDGAARPAGAGINLIQNALSAAHPPTGPSSTRSNAPLSSSTAQKRTFSARSPSPSSSSQPPKARRTDAPIGPRAMVDRDRGTLLDRPLQAGNGHQNGRSLLDRVGPHNRRGSHHNNLSPAQVSHIQAKIDGITGISGPRHHMNGRSGPSPMPPMNGGPAVNPLAMQEMMAMQMNIMAQMAANMGMMNPGAQGPGGFPQQGPGGFPQQQQQNGAFGSGGGPGFAQQHGRGGSIRGGQGQGRGGSMGGAGRGRGASPNQFAAPQQQQQQPQQQMQPLQQFTPAAASSAPERPGTPSLCKYASKCTNSQCRFSHPSPVATAESGMVLSTEFCANGKNCKDKHCTLGHVSPSVLNAPVPKLVTTQAPAIAPGTGALAPCKFGLACTRPGCIFAHPPNFRPPHPSHHHQPTTAVACRFGASCTRGDCPFQHPKGHVSANMFYRGLGPDAPLVEGYVSPHRSVRFGSNAETKAGQKEKEQQTTEKKDEKEVEAVALGNDKAEEKKVVDVGA